MVARAEVQLPADVPAAQQQILSARDWIRLNSPSVEQIEQEALAGEH
jgi:hypothetical protein